MHGLEELKWILKSLDFGVEDLAGGSEMVQNESPVVSQQEVHIHGPTALKL